MLARSRAHEPKKQTRDADTSQPFYWCLLKTINSQFGGEKAQRKYTLKHDRNKTHTGVLNVRATYLKITMRLPIHPLKLPRPQHFFLSTPTHRQTFAAPQRRPAAGKDVCVRSPPPHYHIQALQRNCAGSV